MKPSVETFYNFLKDRKMYSQFHKAVTANYGKTFRKAVRDLKIENDPKSWITLVSDTISTVPKWIYVCDTFRNLDPRTVVEEAAKKALSLFRDQPQMLSAVLAEYSCSLGEFVRKNNPIDLIPKINEAICSQQLSINSYDDRQFMLDTLPRTVKMVIKEQTNLFIHDDDADKIIKDVCKSYAYFSEPKRKKSSKVKSQTKKSEKKMTAKKELRTTITETVNEAKENVTLALELEAGTIINNKLAKLVRKKAPVIVRGYLDTDIAKALIASAAVVVGRQYGPQNEKLQRALDCMNRSAAVDLVRSFNFEEMLDEFLEGVELPGFPKEETKKKKAPKK